MNSKISKIVLGVAASLFSLAVIFYIINAIDAIADLSEYSGSYVEAARTLSIFQLIMEIIILAMGILAIVCCFAPSISKKRALNSIFGVAFLIPLEKMISVIAGFNIIKKYAYPSAELDGTSIVIIVFIIITLILMVAALITNQVVKNPIFGPAFGIAGTISFLVVMILVFVNSEQSTGFTTLYMIFTLIAVLTAIPGLIFAMLNDKKMAYSYHSVTPSPAMENKPLAQKDNAEELLKLKKLLDAGAITQEEYEEKRKKYVDCL